MSKKLDNIRKKIDSLDDRIHDTLMERASLIMGVAVEKRKFGLPFVQPAREAKMIRRLLARHEGALPAAAVIRIWRELVGAVSLMQEGQKISVVHEESSTRLWDMSKAYFGSVVPMLKASSPLGAIASVRENESSFAVLPWPHDGEEAPWWPFLFNQENDGIGVVCVLPYGSASDQTLSWEDKAVVISKTSFVESGEDHSFVVFELDQSVSRARIVDAAKALSLEVLSIFTEKDYQGGPHSLHLIELNHFITQENEKLVALAEKLSEQDVRYAALGGYPVPPVYERSEAEKQSIDIPPAPSEAKAGS